MRERILPLTEQDHALFEDMRAWTRGVLSEERQASFDDHNVKLVAIDVWLSLNVLTSEHEWQLQALGLTLGDAIAQQTGLVWVLSEIDGDQLQVLNWPGSSLTIGALTAIQKRVAAGETIDVLTLFESFCDQVRRFQSLREPKRPWYKKIFGERLM